MQRCLSKYLLLSVLVISYSSLWAGGRNPLQRVNTPIPSSVLHFKENKKQWHPNILYAAELQGAVIYLEHTGITYALYDRDD